MIKPLGDNGIIIYFDDEISEDLLARVSSLKKYIKNKNISGVEEIVSAYNSLAVYYDSLILDFSEIKKEIEALVDMPLLEDLSYETIRIPVFYDGPDLQVVSEHTKLTIEEIINLHTRALYTVYMIGFSPGFPYLGGMDPKLATPRKSTPSLKIQAGSVGIAGKQTGIYSIDSPGGWQIIGRTPLNLFDINLHEPALLKSNMKLKFYQISEEEYINWE